MYMLGQRIACKSINILSDKDQRVNYYLLYLLKITNE